MKLWIDDLRPAPEGHFWCKSVSDAQLVIETNEYNAQWFSDRTYELDKDGNMKYAKRLSLVIKIIRYILF